MAQIIWEHFSLFYRAYCTTQTAYLGVCWVTTGVCFPDC